MTNDILRIDRKQYLTYYIL